MVFEFSTHQLPDPIRLSLRPESTAVALGTERVFSFDGEGRLLTAYRHGRLAKRGLDHRVLEKWRTWRLGRPERIRRDLPDGEKRRLVAEVLRTTGAVLAALPPEAPPAARRRLERIAGWDEGAYAEDRQRFLSVYKPVGILPPDQYLALVLQATEGCHYNRCLFCNFYRGRPFHIKDEAEFQAHIDAVQAFLGAGLGLRRSIFLADANALVVPQRRLVRFFELMHEAFEIAPSHLTGAALSRWKAEHPHGMTGVYSFLDAFTGRRSPKGGKKKTRADFAELAALGLRRVSIGLESGHVPLLRFLRKPSMPADVREVVGAAKAAGVHVGVIVMLGIGGDRYAAGHVADTIAVVNTLDLGPGDILYFSEFVDEPGSEYEAEARAAGLRPLRGEEMQAQADAIRAGLRFAQAPRISVYDIREFIY